MSHDQITATIVVGGIAFIVLLIGFFACIGHCAGCNCALHAKEERNGE